jgi:hypothetical protein
MTQQKRQTSFETGFYRCPVVSEYSQRCPEAARPDEEVLADADDDPAQVDRLVVVHAANSLAQSKDLIQAGVNDQVSLKLGDKRRLPEWKGLKRK